MSAKRLSCLGGIVFCFFLSSALCFSETVFVAERQNQKIVVFEVQDDTLSHVKTIDYGHTEDEYGLGPIDLAADEKHDTLFVSFETRDNMWEKKASAKIMLINTRTLEVMNTVDVSQADDIGGLCFDPKRNVLYGVERNSNKIYEMAWEPSESDLEIIRAIQLPNIDWACALQIDNDTAYVSEYYYAASMEYTEDIKVYDIANNWSYTGSVPMGAETTCLAYDSQRDIFYSGAFDYQGTYQHMAKHAMDPNAMFVKDIETCVIDADVDEGSGNVFITTYQGGGGALQIWDTSGWTADPNQVMEPVDSISTNLSGPAGVLCVGAEPKNDDIVVTKTDGLNGASVVPGDTLTYTIVVDPNGRDHAWVRVVDHLPIGVDYDYVDFSTWPPIINPNYNASGKAYTWELGPLYAADDPVELTIEVTVNGYAEPLGELVNFVTVESDAAYNQYYLETPVGGFGPEVVYVDVFAPAGGNGTSWDLAYQHLADGIDRAELMNNDSNDIEIWVANGTYYPGVETSDVFEIPGEVDVFGGYAGYDATDPNERNIKQYETILSGDNGIERNNTVVQMGNHSLLDGFTVEEAGVSGIDGSNITSESTIGNCVITENGDVGVYCYNGNLTVRFCEIKCNDEHGIWHRGSEKTIDIENSEIHNNQENGLFTEYSIPVIINSVIYLNGLANNDSNYGVNLFSPPDNPVLRNNTIAYNTGAGVNFSGLSCNKPRIKNCIFFYNDAEGGFNDLEGITDTWHCSLTDPNSLDMPKVNPTPDECGNIFTHPGFACPDYLLGNFHLAHDSPCINRGDPNETDAAELDIDGESRQVGTVDIGADEMNACHDDPEDVYNPRDFNADGVVNLEDFQLFSAAWLSHDPNDPTMTTDPNFINSPNYVDPDTCLNWDRDKQYNLDDSGSSAYAIDVVDLDVFWDDWLWFACWRLDLQNLMVEQSAAAGSMMMAAPEAMSLTPTTMSLESVEITVLSPEKSLTEQVFELENSLFLLEMLWENEPDIQQQIDPKSWDEFILSIRSSLEEMEVNHVRK